MRRRRRRHWCTQVFIISPSLSLAPISGPSPNLSITMEWKQKKMCEPFIISCCCALLHERSAFWESANRSTEAPGFCCCCRVSFFRSMHDRTKQQMSDANKKRMNSRKREQWIALQKWRKGVHTNTPHHVCDDDDDPECSKTTLSFSNQFTQTMRRIHHTPSIASERQNLISQFFLSSGSMTMPPSSPAESCRNSIFGFEFSCTEGSAEIHRNIIRQESIHFRR